MKHKTHNSKWVIINILCIATALACLSLTFWGNIKNDGVLTTDAYIGVIATLIGICATVMVGLQIWNHLEFKEIKIKVKELDELENKIVEQHNLMVAEMNSHKIIMSNTVCSIAERENNLAFKVDSLIESICIGIEPCIKADPKANSIPFYIRYKTIDDILNNVNELNFHIGTVNNLKKLSIPKEIDNYQEVCRLHFNIIGKIETLIAKQ